MTAQRWWPFADYELPRVDRLGSHLYGASFPLMKLLPARFILEKAYDEGRLRPGGHIIETTSGTFGLALAMLSATWGYKLTLVSDPAIDHRLRARLQDLGTRVEIMQEPYPGAGYQQVRLDRLRSLLAADPSAFWPDQYGNPHNPAAYERVAEHLAARLGRINCLVGPVGSGGSMVGTARYLRRRFPDLITVGVDTCGSVLFGQHNGPRLLRGLGNSLLPPNLDHTAFDYVSWVPAGPAFRATRRLHQTHGLYNGGTSGAAHLVAEWWARQHPDAVVVAMFPDEGHRYADTIYHDPWLAEVPGGMAALPAEPVLVTHPHDGEQGWSWMHWNRRPLAAVTGGMA